MRNSTGWPHWLQKFMPTIFACSHGGAKLPPLRGAHVSGGQRMTLNILEMAARIRALGDQIVPAAIEGTANLYGPYHEREPYQGVKVTRDQAYGADARHLLDVFEPEASGA